MENRWDFNSAHDHRDEKIENGVHRIHFSVDTKANQVFCTSYNLNNLIIVMLLTACSKRPSVCTEVTKHFMNLPIAYEFYVRDDLIVTSVKVHVQFLHNR